MSDKKFVDWVKPAAEKLQESRRRTVEVAQALPDEAWNEPSPLAGWTYHDLLAHLAVGDWLFQTMLGAVIARQSLEAPQMEWVDARNEELRCERTGRSTEELIAEVIAEGEESQELLSRLVEGDDALQVGRFTVGEWVAGFSQHDSVHTDQLRTAGRHDA